MALEIERKFLVVGEAWLDLVSHKEEFYQGYLSKSPTVRVRITPTQAFITIKGDKTGITCEEVEVALPREEGLKLMPMCASSVHKTRHYIPVADGLKWEVDIFHDNLDGLVMAEIELPNADHVVDLPLWAGLEVSEDHRYSNSYLSDLKSIEDL